MIRLVGSSTPIDASPVCKTAIIKTPIKDPITEPLPPIRLVPPITAAAIADSSKPIAALGSEEASLAVNDSAAKAQRVPEIMNTEIW